MFHRNIFLYLNKGISLTFSSFDFPLLQPIKRLYNHQVSYSIQSQLQNSKERNLRKSFAKSVISKSKDSLVVTAFSTAHQYKLESLDGLSFKDFKEISISDDFEENCMLLEAIKDSKSKIFLFGQGSVAFWNVEKPQISEILSIIKKIEVKPYNESLVIQEKEEMDFVYTDSKPKLFKNLIHINEEDSILSQYTFSNGLVLSVKLAILEASLDKYIESIKCLSEDIKDGNKVKLTRKQVFQKTGELFTLRHQINLESDLLDTPDFYWDRQNLEILFHQVRSNLNISKRTKVMNEKLNFCYELMSLVSNDLNDKHHIRLEWMIIILIMMEVFFEIIHYIERFF